jgi:hypothetical protein
MARALPSPVGKEKRQRGLWAPFAYILVSRGASFPSAFLPMTAYNFPSLQSGDQLVSYYPVKTIYGDICAV